MESILTLDMSYWYVFPIAVLVAITANAAGFSGSVLFQPFFYFVLRLPLAQSIATGIATETLGMTSGSIRYAMQGMHANRQLGKLLIFTATGVVLGLFLFAKLPANYLRLLVGLVVLIIASFQLWLTYHKKLGHELHLPSGFATKYGAIFSLAGMFSASTGTGVAEISQPMLENKGKLATRRANATAILLEAGADWVISLFNLTVGNINLSVLLFSGTGVIIGAQIGAKYAHRLPERLLKTIFSISLILISGFYIYRFFVD